MLNNLTKIAVYSLITLCAINCAEISVRERARLVSVNNNQDFSHLINALPIAQASAPEIELDIYDEQPGAQVEGMPTLVPVMGQMGELSPVGQDSYSLLEQLREPREGDCDDQKLLSDNIASDDVNVAFPATGQTGGTIALLPQTGIVSNQPMFPAPSAPAIANMAPALNPEFLKINMDNMSYDWHLGPEKAFINKKFLDAAQSNKDLSEFQNLITNLDVQDNDGMTALMYAVKSNSFDQLKILLAMKVNLNSLKANNAGHSALNLACAFSNLEMIKLLIANGAKLTHQDLKFAVAKNSVDVVKELYNSLFGYEILPALIQCAFVHDSESAKYLWEQQNIKNTHLKVEHENSDVLFEVPFGTLPVGTTALHWAVRNNEFDLVKLLIARKANINAVDGEGNTPFIRLVHPTTMEKNRRIIKDSNIYECTKFRNSLFYTGSKYCLNQSIFDRLVCERDLDVSIINNDGAKVENYLYLMDEDLLMYIHPKQWFHDRIKDVRRRDKTVNDGDCCVIL